LIEVPDIRCVAGRGIEGDRFFDFKENYAGQITFFSSEVFDELCFSLRVRGNLLELRGAMSLPREWT
jgi:hypothetical protein